MTGIHTVVALTNLQSPAPSPRSIRILGIDPGSQRTGVGIIEVDGAGRMTHVFHAPLDLLVKGDIADGAFSRRLKRLLDGLWDVISTHRPDEVAIEQVFMARNPDSALKLGQARGAAICAVVMRDLPVHEYAAREVKLAVVGKGSAEKQQIQHMVGIMLNLHGKLQADAADALAVAITHAHVRASAQRLGVGVREAWSRK
jgi:crossover junction endodeoxyribonuclease RuvC